MILRLFLLLQEPMGRIIGHSNGSFLRDLFLWQLLLSSPAGRITLFWMGSLAWVWLCIVISGWVCYIYTIWDLDIQESKYWLGLWFLVWRFPCGLSPSTKVWSVWSCRFLDLESYKCLGSRWSVPIQHQWYRYVILCFHVIAGVYSCVGIFT